MELSSRVRGHAAGRKMLTMALMRALGWRVGAAAVLRALAMWSGLGYVLAEVVSETVHASIRTETQHTGLVTGKQYQRRLQS